MFYQGERDLRERIPEPHPMVFAITHIIMSIVFLIGLILAIRRYKRKKSAPSLVLIFLMLQGCLFTLGEYIVYYTSWWQVMPFFGSIGVFIFITSLILVNMRLEKKIEESDKEIRESKKQLKEQLERLKELDNFRSDLVRRTSHELKTPLISLFSSTQYLLDTYREDMSEDIRKFIRIINRGGKRLKQLTDNLLDAYNIESRGLQLNKENIDIIKSIKECANDLIFSLEERDLYLKQNLEDEFFITVDKARIEQVILNLLSNAIKNTPKKGIIFISIEHNDKNLDIVIKDTGIGLVEEEKEKLFKKFGKIERNNIDSKIDTEGSGLGLFISKEIVELHDGEILVESEGKNKGSTFIVRIPLNS
jgi:signal transduction histidine kinase